MRRGGDLRWRRPRRPATRLDHVPALLGEAATFGITGLDGLSAFGRALVDGDDPERTLESLLPKPVDHVLLQADLTAIAPGPLEQELARQLALLADVESRGGATVYRFDASSVRRAARSARAAPSCTSVSLGSTAAARSKNSSAFAGSLASVRRPRPARAP